MSLLLCVLLMYVGAKLDAPWWYWTLIGVLAVAQIVKIGIDIGRSDK